PMHFSVGAVIEAGGKYLLIDRDMEPLGFAGLAGHINDGETPEETLFRKVKEESGLEIKKHSLLFEEEVEWNWCRAGIWSHYWYLYKCEVEGEILNNPEASKSIGWYAPEEMKKLKWEPVWKYWFEKLGVL
ncbi:MAG: NUDIX domain-containing protein, partial [bacterium]|nr:NUDIX domain-containing protein [bacterium]